MYMKQQIKTFFNAPINYAKGSFDNFSTWCVMYKLNRLQKQLNEKENPSDNDKFISFLIANTKKEYKQGAKAHLIKHQSQVINEAVDYYENMETTFYPKCPYFKERDDKNEN